jgi:hypothetical protein
VVLHGIVIVIKPNNITYLEHHTYPK